MISPSLTEDKSKIGTRIGMDCAMSAAGAVIAGPGAGAILERHGESHLDCSSVFVFSAACAAVTTVGFIVLRIVRVGLNLSKV